MQSLVDFVLDNTPLFAPFGKLAVVVGLFVLAWLVRRAAGRVAARVVDRSERRHAREDGTADTGVIEGLRQRETAVSLFQTGIGFLAYALAIVLSIATLTGARRIETIAGASFLAILLGFAAQRFLTDVMAGVLMFFEGWFRVGDSIEVAPWGIQGVVEGFSLRAIRLRGIDGQVQHVSNANVLAMKVSPRGYRELEFELYVSDLEAGRALVEHVARGVPAGPTHFVRRPSVEETEELDDDLHRIRGRAAVAPGREWLADDFLPSVMTERAAEGLVVHGPVVMPVDEQATRRFARSVWTGGGGRGYSRSRRMPALPSRRSRSRTDSSSG